MDGKGLSKALIEENVQLKLYIDELNKECLELQAALFEEANKMAQDAYAARHTAVKRAEELSKENGVLKNEVQALKRLLRLHQEESADAIAVCRSVSGVSSRSEVFSEVNGKSASSRRLSLLRSATTSLPPTGVSAGEMDKDRFLSTSTSIINVTSQEPVTRKYLLEALTSGVSCADSIGDKHYQEFIDWVDGGCYINWCDNASLRGAKRQSIGVTFAGLQSRQRTESDVGDITLPSPPQASSPPGTTFLPPPPPSPKEQAFFWRVVDEDVTPALDFADSAISKSLWISLSHLGVDMEPLSASDTPLDECCPLVPSHNVKFSLKLLVVHNDGSTTRECYNISAYARQRIAAVADLFQYLTLIRRGLTGTPTTPTNQSPSNSLKLGSRTSSTSDPVIDQTRRHQFENVQRRRLAVTLSRLGYGLPLME